jgi:hypothetical protein
MTEELIGVALRVLACVTLCFQDPDPQDVARLRDAVAGEEQGWEVDALAAYIIHREVRARNVIGAAL